MARYHSPSMQLPEHINETATPVSTESDFLNRDLSWLEFNRRVLHEAVDERTPLLERVRFLGIFTSNLDEFFMKRVGGLRRQVAANLGPSLEGICAAEAIVHIRS